MIASMRRRLSRLNGWPRRVAALACLVLAAGSALAPRHTSAGVVHRTTVLRPGEVAVAVPVGAAGAHVARPGERVSVLAPPADGDTGPAVAVADRMRVLSVSTVGELGSDDGGVVEVATDRDRALALARYSNRALVLIVDDLP